MKTPKTFAEMTVPQLNTFIQGSHRSGDYDGQFNAACLERNNREAYLTGPEFGASLKLTRKMAKHYIMDNGARCPFCHSANIEGDMVEVNGPVATQYLGCNDCGEGWKDTFKRVDAIQTTGQGE